MSASTRHGIGDVQHVTCSAIGPVRVTLKIGAPALNTIARQSEISIAIKSSTTYILVEGG